MDFTEIKDFPVNTKSLKEVRDFSRNIISKSPILKETKDELILAISEAAQNIVKHAYKDNHETKDKMQIKISFKDNQLEIGLLLLFKSLRVLKRPKQRQQLLNTKKNAFRNMIGLSM